MTHSDNEEPVTDVAEQDQVVAPGAPVGEERSELPGKLPLEADAADAAEQAREVDLDEDDYR